MDERFQLQASKQRHFVCIVSHGEVLVLAQRCGWGQDKKTLLQNTLDNLVTIDINHPRVLEAYVQIDIVSQQHPEGARNMGKNDLWIAACAKAAGATLLTTDKDFAHLTPAHLDIEVTPPDIINDETSRG